MRISRAEEKLQFAITKFKLNIKNKVVADFGANVGGFTNVLLNSGAKKVYAVDTGYGTFNYQLRKNKKVVVHEKTNAMHIQLPKKCDLICIDVGWTPQTKIIPNAIKNLKNKGEIVSLLKTHYEFTNLNPKVNLKQNPITKKQAIQTKLLVIKQIEKQTKAKVVKAVKSPIKGKTSGNIEYLLLIKKTSY